MANILPVKAIKDIDNKTTALGEMTPTDYMLTRVPAFRAHATAAKACAASTFTILPFGGVDLDTHGWYTPSRYTPQVAGWYHVYGSFNVGTATRIIATIYKNGTAYDRGNDCTGNLISVTDLVYMNGTTDYIEIYAYTVTAQSTALLGIFTAHLVNAD